MRARGWAVAVWVTVALLPTGCRGDSRMGPGEAHLSLPLSSAAQCLVAPGSDPTTGPASIVNRLAWVFADDEGRAFSNRRAPAVVCLSQEQGRWRLLPGFSSDIHMQLE
jgi:hypothetical protein